MNLSNPGLSSDIQNTLGVSEDLLEKLNEGIMFVDHTDTIQFANQKFYDLTRCNQDSVLGKAPFDLYRIADTGKTMDRVLALRNARKPHLYEIELSTTLGTNKWFRISNSPIFDDNNIYQGAFEVFREITDQKLAENLLQESETRFRNLADSSPVLIWMADIDNRFYYFNKPFLDFTGRDIKDELGEGIFEDIHPEDKESFKKVLSKSNTNKEAFKAGFRMLSGDGEYRWMLCVGKPRIVNKHYAGHIGSCVDITELKDIQKELEEQTLELQRSNEELEQFAYVASHDLQEPLRMISSYVQIIEKKLHGEERHDLDEFMKYAIDGVGRLQELINDLLNYSRVNRSEDPFIKTNLGDIVEGVKANLKHLIEKHNVTIEYSNLPELHVDQSQILRVFQNLIENSIKFRAQGNPVIKISSVKVDGGYQFSIDDNGIGIDPKHFERIFVIFHRLHSRQAYKGTGIGLAICKRIIERHRGRIWVESGKGQGATFYFVLKDMDQKQNNENSRNTFG